MIGRLLSIFGITASLGGCASLDMNQAVPALLSNPGAESRAEIAKTISDALDGRRIVLASDVLTADSRVIIDPVSSSLDPYGNPADGRVLGKPDHFQLKSVQGKCVLVHDQTGEFYVLTQAQCLPA